MNQSLLLLSLLCVILSCSSPRKNQTIEEIKLAEFDEFIDNITEEYIYLNSRHEEFECIKDAYRNEVIQLTSVREHVLFYETIMMEFWDNHVQLNTNVKESYRVDIMMYTSFDGHSTKVENIWQSQMDQLPKQNIIGSEIIRFNGVPFQEMIDDFPTRCLDKQNPEIRSWIGNKILAGKYSEPRIIDLLLKDGSTISVDIDSLKVKYDDSFLDYKLIDNIGYIKINNSLGEDGLVNEFNQTLDQMHNTKALILDLRHTESGGNTGVAEPILGRFISEEMPYQLYQNKKKKYFGYIIPKGKTYTKPLYVLCNHWTGSMGEGVTVGLDGLKRATIIGTEMARLRGGMNSFKFLTKDYYYKFSFEKIFHIDGTPREEFVPEFLVKQEQLHNDEILQKALEMIRSK